MEQETNRDAKNPEQLKPTSSNKSNINMEELKKTFTCFDRNCDGSIEADELYAVIKSLGFNITYDDSLKMVEQADLNGNKKIEFDEFINFILQHEEYLKSKYSILQCEEDMLNATFKVFDRRKNGFISRCDLKQAMRELGENVTENELDLMMQEADKDKNGRIDFEEFKILHQFILNQNHQNS